MAAARKLSAEIDKTLKKVAEGIAVVEDMWHTVDEADSQALREKHEGDLKKEIKRLQRLRDSLKTWSTSGEVKQKQPLIDAKKAIEKKMEAFKVLERTTKTKAYSRQGLMMAGELDPEAKAKKEARDFLTGSVQQLTEQIDEMEAEIEAEESKRRGSTSDLAALHETVGNHQFHIEKLEQLTRMLDNDGISHERIMALSDEMSYYLESNREDDFYPDLDVYDQFGELAEAADGAAEAKAELERAEAAERERKEEEEARARKAKARTKQAKVTVLAPAAVATASASSASAATISSSKGGAAAAAAAAAAAEAAEAAEAASSKGKSVGKAASTGSRKAVSATAADSVSAKPPSAVAGKSRVQSAIASGGVSMASVLRSAHGPESTSSGTTGSYGSAAAAAASSSSSSLSATAATAGGVTITSTTAGSGRGSSSSGSSSSIAAITGSTLPVASPLPKPVARPVTLTPVMPAAAPAPAPAPAAGASAAGAAGHGDSSDEVSAEAISATLFRVHGAPVASSDGVVRASAGLGACLFLGPDPSGTGSADSEGERAASSALAWLFDADTDDLPSLTAPRAAVGATALSLAHIPGFTDIDRGRVFVPRHPVPAKYLPGAFPQTPVAKLDDPALFEKLSPDTLFFAFYFMQGTHHQSLAAKQLHASSWRLHREYGAWFQRFKGERNKSDTSEVGPCKYFDYEDTWTERILPKFEFRYDALQSGV